MPIPAGSWARWLDWERFGVVLHGAGDAQNAAGGVDMNGWLDEVRITKGVARYSLDSGFAVPTAAYPRF